LSQALRSVFISLRRDKLVTR